MALGDIVTPIIDGITYDTVKIVFGSIIVSTGLTVILRRFFDKLTNRKEEIQFWALCFVVICTLFIFMGTRTQEPKLTLEAQSITSGNIVANDKKGTISVITIGVVNAGNMQTIMKQWDVLATINGDSVHGVVLIKPKDITFDTTGHGANLPLSVSYKAEDNILDKSLLPIQPGSAVYGELFVLFDGIDIDSFKAASIVTITAQDALSKQYVAAIKSSGKFEMAAPLASLHTEMVCPAPKPDQPLVAPLASPAPSPPPPVSMPKTPVPKRHS